MSIEEQIEIVEDNIAEYGVCDITIEEYRFLKQKIRADVVDEFKIDIINKINFEEKWLLDCKSNNADTNNAFGALKTFVDSRAKQLKEKSND